MSREAQARYEERHRKSLNQRRRERMAEHVRPSPQELTTILEYDEITGMVRWLNPSQQQPKGWHHGIASRGYWAIKINYRGYRVHVVAWTLKTGEWPDDFEIDHKDKNRGNNRWDNLRKATRQQNARNQRLSKVNNTGVTGVVHFRDRFRAMIGVNRKIIYLGYFDTLEEAAKARREAEIRYFGEFAPQASTPDFVVQRGTATVL
jgi:hypothetical protein